MLRLLILYSSLLMLGVRFAAAQSNSTRPAQAPTVIDGGAGPCSLEITVTTPDGKPAAAADVKVHIAYGFGGFHKLDLEAGASQDGRVKFTGLPARVRRPPLEFRASQDQLVGTVQYDPATECQAKRAVALAKANPNQP